MGNFLSAPTIEYPERANVPLLKTIAVIILIAVALGIMFAVIGFLAFAIWTLVKVLIIAAVVGVIYHHFAHQKAL